MLTASSDKLFVHLTPIGLQVSVWEEKKWFLNLLFTLSQSLVGWLLGSLFSSSEAIFFTYGNGYMLLE